jgi:YVTN family beta-propeller protein
MNRSRWALVGVVALVASIALAITKPFGNDESVRESLSTLPAESPEATSSPDSSGTATTDSLPAGASAPVAPLGPDTTVMPTTTTLPPPVFRPTTETSLVELERIVTSDANKLTPKSVVASRTGLVSAQNMIYSHTVSVFGADGSTKAVIDDRVTPSDFGIAGRTSSIQGGPVEAAFTPDGSKLYVSNYSMYGPGYGSPGDDKCGPDSGIDDSFVYRIDSVTLQIDQLIEVGAVPKYVAVSPDSKYVLVTNWCDYDMSVIDTASGTQVQRIKIGRYPRGIVVSPDSTIAYVAVMGGNDIAKVSLVDFSVSWISDIGNGPRHLVLSPDGTTLYATLNKDGRVIKIDVSNGAVLARVATGSQPRSMDISSDGLSLYVVNYESNTMTKVRTSDMEVVQTMETRIHPIGIAYEPTQNTVWVATYRGTIHRFAEQ